MFSSKLAKFRLIGFLLLIMLFSSSIVAASEISVYFSETNFIVSYEPGEMRFTATVGNASSFPNSSVQIVITNSTSGLEVQNLTGGPDSSGNIYFSGYMPTRAGTYNVSYYVNGANATPSSGTPTKLTVSYQMEALLSVSNPQIDQNNLSITGYITDKYGKAITIIPYFSVSGAKITSSRMQGGYFYVYLDTITAAGPEALKFFVDDVEAATWDVSSSPLASLSIEPGYLLAGVNQSIRVNASIYEYYNSSPRTLDLNDIIVELSGVPMLASSVRGHQSAEYADNNNDTYKKVVITAQALQNLPIEFTTTGNLRVLASTAGYRHQKVVEIPVLSVNNFDLKNAPKYLSYIGDNLIDLKFVLPNNKTINQYWADITLPDGQVISMQNGSGALESIPALQFISNGQGKITANVRTIDREGDQHDVRREYSFALPTMELSAYSLPLNETNDLVITLKDVNGNPINDARVNVDRIGGLSRSNGASGEYRFNSQWTYPGYLRITAYSQEGEILADTSTMFKVQAPEVWELVSDTSTILAGADNQIRVKLYDESGREVTSAKVMGYVDYSSTPIVMNYTNNAFTMRARAWQNVRIEAEANDGKKAAPAIEVQVSLPIVEASIEAITRGYMETVELSFKHPDTKELLQGEMNIRVSNLEHAIRNQKSDGKTVKEGSTFSFDIVTRIPRTTEASEVYIDFSYNNRDYNAILVLPVKEAEVVFNPEKIIRGPEQNVVITVNSASGSPMSGVSIAPSGGSSPKQTNAKGQVQFAVRPGNNEFIEFTVLRDDKLLMGSMASNFKVTIPVFADTKAPTIAIVGVKDNTIQAATTPYDLSIKFTDDTALNKFNFANDAQIQLSGTSHDWTKQLFLRPGENTYNIRVTDSSNNASTVVLTIVYTPPVTTPETPKPDPVDNDLVTMVLDSLIVKRGNTILPEPPVAPQVIEGRTMLPFRYLCQTVMQGEVNYDADTQTILTIVNDHEVKMVVGEKTIYVDGEEVELDIAPLLSDGHTLVPVVALRQIVSDIGWYEATRTVTIKP